MAEKNVQKDAQAYGAYVRQKREEKGLTVRAFAEMLGVTPAYISDLEKNNRPAPRISSPRKLLEKICEILMDTDEERHRYYDLAAESRDGQYDELNDYLQQHANARLALRVARDGGLNEEDWNAIAREIRNRSAK